jgi:hypothetical protein
MIVAVVVPPLDSQSFEKTLHAASFPGLPAPDGHEEGNIAILLQRYDSLRHRARLPLSSKTLPSNLPGGHRRKPLLFIG